MKGYKYRGGIGVLDKDGKSIFERDINTIVNNQIYLPTRDELNDPTEGLCDDNVVTGFIETYKDYSSGIKKQYYALIDKLKNSGIYSLSKNNDNELLWAYYASGHTGFAIEYDIDILKSSLNHNPYFPFVFDFDIDYVKRIPKADISLLRGNDITHFLKVYLGSKSSSWSHEKEYRLIFEGKGLFDIDYRAVTGIYFGYKMNDLEVDFIMNKLRGRGLDYYKMELIENTYKFKPVKIEDKYSNSPKYIANSIDYNIDELMICGGLDEYQTKQYKDKFTEALESIKNDPSVKNFYIATLGLDDTEPLLKIFANTKSGTPPVREFNFKLDDKGNVYRVK